MSSDDIVTRLREYEAITDNAYVINALVAAADEIERLRAERLQWFVVARQLRHALIGAEKSNSAVDEYLRTRGRLETPRE